MNNKRQGTGITKGLIVGVFLIPLHCYWLIHMEMLRYFGHATIIGIFFNVIFSIFLIVLINPLLRKISLKLVFSQQDVLIVFIVLSQASAICGHSLIQVLVPSIAAPYGLATPENGWKDLFVGSIPTWLVVHDMKALDQFLKGGSNLYNMSHIRAWLTPILVWSGFLITLLLVMICINFIFSHQWIKKERLPYPIVYLPLEMSNLELTLFKNRLMWVGFSIVAFLGILNGLHAFYPSVPHVPMKNTYIGHLFINRPWSAVRPISLIFFPFIIGLAFLIPLELAFSFWFFFLFFWKGQLILGDMFSWQLPSIAAEQAGGAYIALSLIAIWSAKKHLYSVFRNLFGHISETAKDRSYQTAIMGIVIGFILIILFCCKAGMSIWVSVTFFIIYFFIAVSVVRVRTQLGSPVHDLHFSGPEVMMIDGVGVRRLGQRNLSIIPFFWFLSRAHYSDVPPHQAEAFFIGEKARISHRNLFLCMILTTVVAIPVSFWAYLDVSYRFQGKLGFGHESFVRLQKWITNPTEPNVRGLGLFFIGLGFTLFLNVMNRQFIWWPFHPAGYAVSSTHGGHLLWFPIFLSWSMKLLILKYGGQKAYKTALPFFLGLVLGDFVLASFWTLIGIVFNLNIAHQGMV